MTIQVTDLELDSIKKTIYSELFSPEMTKGDKTKANILEATIEVVNRKGYSDTRFQDVAAECGHTRTLVNHYFPTKSDLFTTLAKYIRLNYQQYVLSQLENCPPEEFLRRYVRAALWWTLDCPKESKIWLLVFHLATFDDTFKGLNTDLVKMGFERICRLLKDKKITQRTDIAFHAKMIQTIITGCVVCVHTEDLSRAEKVAYIENSLESCLSLF